jgi:hypothetical protein
MRTSDCQCMANARAVRRLTAVLCVAIVVLTASVSCTPETKAVTGLTVDEQGRILAALAWCADRPPTVVVVHALQNLPSPTHTDATDAASPGSVAIPDRQYTVSANVTSPTTVPLNDFPPPAADAHTTFRVYAVGPHNSFTSHAVRVNLAELADLTPGSILITTDTAQSGHAQGSVSLEEFERRGNGLC